MKLRTKKKIAKICEPFIVWLGMLTICLFLCLTGAVAYRLTNDVQTAITVSVVVTSAFWLWVMRKII